MKSFSVLVPLFLATATTQAAVIASDLFDYADGALNGQNGGTGFSDAWSVAFGTGNNISDSAVVGGGSGGNIRTLSTPFASSGELWFSIDFGATSPIDTFAGLSFFGPDAGLTGRTEKVLVGDGFNTDVWGIAIPNGGGSALTSTTHDDAIKTGVGRITLGSGLGSTIDLWVGSNAIDAVDVSGTADATLSGIELEGITQIRLAAGSSTVFYDNFILGDTYADVGAVLIPEPSSMVLLLGGFAGMFIMQRRRRA